MLKINQITYEIWDENTNEVLVDGLTFEEAAEQCAIYQEFFGDGVIVAFRESAKVINIITREEEYKRAHLDYIEDLYAMGNIL
jgi:hypothetical protein